MQLTTAVASRRSCNGDELQGPAGVNFLFAGPIFCCIRGVGPWGTCAPTGERRRRGRAATATARANGDGDDDEVDAPWLGAGWPVALALLDLTRKVDDDAEGDQSDG